MKRNNIIIFLLVLSVMLVTGCESGFKTKTCTKTAASSDNSMSLSTETIIYYKNDYVLKTVSTEKLTSSSSSILEMYKNAAESSYSKYKDIKYYDNTITMGNTTLTSKTIIDYRKVDYKKILEVEGESGNIFTKDGKVKLTTLTKLYTDAGLECE